MPQGQAEIKSEVNEATIARARAREAAFAALQQLASELSPAAANVEQKQGDESQTLDAQLAAKLTDLVAHKAEVKSEEVEALRRFLLEKIIALEAEETKLLCDRAFQVQVLLTQLWPLGADENGDPLDLVELEPIPLPLRVASASGNIFKKTELKNQFCRLNAFEFVEKIGLRVMRDRPTQENLPPGVDSTYVLIQPAMESAPTELYFVDKMSQPPLITKLSFPRGKNPATLMQKLYPHVRQHRYKEKDTLNSVEIETISDCVGYAHRIKYNNPYGGYFTRRDLKYFRENGVTVPEPNKKLYLTVGMGRLFDEPGARISNFRYFLAPFYQMYIRARINVGSHFRNGANKGFVVGILLASCVLGAVIATLWFFTPLSFWIALTLGVIGGIIESKRNHGQGCPI